MDLFTETLSVQLKATRKRYESLAYFIDEPYLIDIETKNRTQITCESELRLVKKYENQVVYWLSKKLTREDNEKVVLFSAKVIEWEIVLKKTLGILHSGKRNNFLEGKNS